MEFIIQENDPLIAAEQAPARIFRSLRSPFRKRQTLSGCAKFAAAGMGQHFHATTASQLNDAFREIAERLPIF